MGVGVGVTGVPVGVTVNDIVGGMVADGVVISGVGVNDDRFGVEASG